MDWICYDGTATPPHEAGITPDRLLSEDYVYQRIHTYAHRALHLHTHLEIIARALERIHGVAFRVSAETLQQKIGELLGLNRFPRQSNCVTIRVFPHGLRAETETPEYLIETTSQLFYPRYTLWHHRPLLDVCPCDPPFAGYPTAQSLLAGRYAREWAGRRGAEIAVLETRRGVLTNIDDEPLFLVFGRQIMTTPAAEGANDSALRRLVLSRCRAERLPVTEYPLTRELLARCDEAFTVTVQGIVPILGFGQRRYFHLTAVRLSEKMNRTELR